ncbi:MAG: hypothetical protein ACTSRO_09055, partial [Candidatus Heimdallarchaeaceae archaeon]
SYNNSNNLYFIALDSTIQEMINNPPPITKQFYFNQERGELLIDESWRILLILKDLAGTQSNLVLDENLTRVIHKSTATADYEKGEHRYLIGPQDQDYLFINGSSTIYNEISILNASRTFYDSSFLQLALYYRYVLSLQYSTAANQETYTLNIIHVNLIRNQSAVESSTQKFISLELTYLGTREQNGGTMAFTTDLIGETRVLDQYGIFQYEYPLYLPVNANYISHVVQINIINIDVSISIS